MNALPFAIVGSETEVTNSQGVKVRGREYLWGNVEVENEAHCDFVKLRSLLIRTHMHDLITHTNEVHYENYRNKLLLSQGKSENDSVLSKKPFSGKADEEALRRRFTEQVRAEEARFRTWEQKLIGERDRLNKDLENQHSIVKILEEEVEELKSARR